MLFRMFRGMFLFALIWCFGQFAEAEELRILCWEGYAAPEYTASFEQLVKEKFGLDVTVIVRNVSDPQEFFDGIRGKTVDLISPAHNIPKSERWPLIQAGLVLPLNLDNIPNYAQIIPTLQHAEYITENGQVYGAPIVYGPYGLAYNTAVFPEAPTSWQVLWDPQYHGKYAISADYHEANIYTAGLAAGLSKEQIFQFTAVSTTKIQRRIDELAQYATTLWVGVDTADDLQGLALSTAWGFAFPELQRRGEIWKMAEPKEGTTGWVDNWMISANLKDNPTMKAIAEAWINHSLSPDVQVGYVRNIAQFPVNLSIKDRLTPEENATYHLDDPTYFEQHFVLWKILSRDDQDGFRRMWKKAMQKRAP
ncbi:ABC transport protein [Candidatus Moduliflexus flocculans]|uniref:ABC transport protein n=1 Tax=Candidatus Moduliflexus flocculans TaxID=1499966 RepID=A0A081BLP7_9BACT|nr:ABC transport protein [Candidatus Moduliflexus flocculans]